MKHIILLLTLALHPAAYADEQVVESSTIQRIRVTETSITETGRLSGLSELKLKTKGYGLTYIHESGIGGSYTFLTTRGSDVANGIPLDVELRHKYVDVNFTYGTRFIITTGFGFGVSGDGSIGNNGINSETTWSESKSLTLGPGFSLGWFEIYWIYRRNWAAFHSNSNRLNLASKHFMLGLGGHF